MTSDAMATPALVRTLAAYNAEMNRRLFAAAGRLPDAARRAEGGAFWGSIHGTFCHLLWADRMWMSRFAGWAKPDRVQKDSAGLIADYPALAAARAEADAGVEAWAAEVTADWLAGQMTWFSGSSGQEATRRRDLLVVHMFNHQTHHRGQAHALLTRAGQDTGATDLPWVLPAGAE